MDLWQGEIIGDHTFRYMVLSSWLSNSLTYSSTYSCNKYLLNTNSFAKLSYIIITVIHETDVVSDFTELIV